MRTVVSKDGTTIARAMPHGQQRTLGGQTHEVAVDELALVLIEFFTSPASSR